MSLSITGKIASAALLALPAMFGFSLGPPPLRTGAAADGGLTCAACHRTFAPENSDPRGSVKIGASAYTPGVKQTLTISIAHPDQKRWGFELTARLANDPSKPAGTFSIGPLVRVRCSSGSDAPCNGGLEFAEHNNAQVTAVGAGFTYSVDWTPAADLVGDVIFYAAGNAADGNAALTNDRIYTTSALISPATCNLSSLPVVSAVVNSASWSGAISPGAIVSLFGSGFQPFGMTRGLYPQDVASGVFPTKLSCFSVEVDRKRVPITYVSANQVNVQVPFTAGTTASEFRVIVNPDSRNVFSAPLIVASGAYSPALYTFDGIHAAAQFAGTSNVVGDPAATPAGKPARAGDLVTLYATGLGDTIPHVDAGLAATGQATTAAAPSVAIGGVTVPASDIQYSGLVPGMISGLYQINLKVPAGIAAGDAPVKITIGGIANSGGPTLRMQ